MKKALDGILGFGKADSSLISQLASSGKVKKIFAHCLNGVNGGGIFAIGHVVQLKVNVTRLLQDHLSTDASQQGDRKETIIDSGTTLAYLPEAIYEPLVFKGNFWCIGWQNSRTQSRDNKNMTLLGDLVLSNKLVIYNLKSQVIGWTEYNCCGFNDEK
ncbi:hypothetical protein AAHE18_11G146500 [Arachis hypogaea]